MQTTEKTYRCRRCGTESKQKTNHYGSTRSFGRINACPNCPPWAKYPEFGGATVWDCVDKPKAGFRMDRKTGQFVPTMNRIEEIKTQLAAYRDGFITYDREHVRQLQEDRLRLEREARGVKCPKCGSTDIAGLIAAFYVPLDANGEPKGQWTEWQSNTELTPSRSCASCNHEWAAK